MSKSIQAQKPRPRAAGRSTTLGALGGLGIFAVFVLASWGVWSAIRPKARAPQIQQSQAPEASETAVAQKTEGTEPSAAEVSGQPPATPEVPAPTAKSAMTALIQDPEALIGYAERMEPRLEEAEENPVKARELFEELEQCVGNGKQKGGPAVQALCLSSAEELADIYPEFEDKFETLKKTASPNVVQLMEGPEEDL